MEDQALFEANTKYAKEPFIKFQRFAMFRRGASGKIMIIVLVFLYIVGIAAFVIAYLKNDYSGIPYGIMCLFLAVFYTFLPQINFYLIFKKSRALFDTGVFFSFFENHFITVTENDVLKSTSDVKYEGLFKICETKSSYYLYLSRAQSFMLDKDSFTLGTPEGLTAMLEKNLPEKKFVRYTK